MAELFADKIYRFCYTMDKPELRGACVAFLGWRPANAWDIRRARVMIVGNHPQKHTEYLVNPGLLILA